MGFSGHPVVSERPAGSLTPREFKMYCVLEGIYGRMATYNFRDFPMFTRYLKTSYPRRVQ